MKTTENRPRYGLNEIKAAARGRWPEILRSLGVAENYTDTRKHQPRPACGGKDRFRFTDYKQGGGFICNHCTPEGGSGLDLLMLVYGYTFAEAVQAVAVVLGMAEPAGRGIPAARAAALPAAAVADATEEEEKARKRLAVFWNECTGWDETPLIADYLHGRGIPIPEKLPVTADLRLHSRADYWHNKRKLGHFPAMVGMFRQHDGKPCGLHITYLHSDRAGMVSKAALFDPASRERLPVKKMRSVRGGALTGAAIRLFKPENGVLGVCEGIETAFAARYVSGVPMWACGSAHGIQSLVLPDGIRELVIIADNDANGAGIQAARALQRRYARKLEVIKVWQPDSVGADALDALVAYVQKGGAS